jgi:hypothetical protein
MVAIATQTCPKCGGHDVLQGSIGHVSGIVHEPEQRLWFCATPGCLNVWKDSKK